MNLTFTNAMASFSQLQYYSTPLAERMLAHERIWLSQQIRTCVGSHAAIITRDPYARSVALFDDFYVAVSASIDATDKNHICCDLSALPFSNESMDVLVLQHVTDGSDQAVQILREAQRVLIPGGRLLFIADNPFSLFGISHWYTGGRAKQQYRKGLIKQWLAALDIQVLSSHNMFHEMPLNNTCLLQHSYSITLWAARHNIPFGGVYGFVAIKSARPVNPLRWQKLTWQSPLIRPTTAHQTKQNTYEKR